MDLQQIGYFVRVTELGSFSRAADSLNISQPALSRQVQLLEHELRQQLLHRHGRGVELTEAGKQFLGHAKALLDLARRAKEELRMLDAAPTGRVAIGLPPRVGRVLTPHLLPAFRKRFPAASIAISEGLSAHMREWLLDARVDIALLYDPPPSPKLRYESLFREHLLLIGKSTGGASLPEQVPYHLLSAYPLILPSMPNAIRVVVESACRAKNVALNVVAEVDAVQTAVALAADGHDHTIAPRSAVAPGLAAARIGSPPLSNRLVMATLRNRRATRLVEETRRLIATVAWEKLFGSGR